MLVVNVLILLSVAYSSQAAKVIFGYEDPSKNLFKNWDFESHISSSDWRMDGASGSRVSGGKTGSYSLKVSNRASITASPVQSVYGIKPDTFYYVSAHIKLLNNPTGTKWVRIIGKPRIYFKDGTIKNTKGGTLTYQRVNNRWQQIGADFLVAKDAKYVEYRLQVEPSNVNYQLDTVSMIELPKQSNWKTQLNNDINRYRKNSVTVTGNVNGLDLSKTQITVELKRHEFGFGTAIQADPFNRDRATETNYRNFILKHFNWAVFENDMKWKPMEKVKGAIKYGRVDKAINTLKANNFTIRGHAGTWDIKKTNPLWVQSKSGSALKAEIDRRLTYMFKRYDNDIFEWDLCNEYVHQHFYEDKTGIFNMLEKQFKLARQLAPNAKLCMNDYEIARGGGVQSSNNLNIVHNLKAAGVNVDCLGVQAHLKTVPIRPESLKQRMKTITSAGLPVSVTELSLHTGSVTARAQAVDTAFRTFFANPHIQAVVLWGFADQFGTFANDYFLTNGPNFTPNAAGNKLLNLIHKEWHTKVSVPPQRYVSKTFSGFRGTYTITVKEGGAIRYTKDFYLGKGANNVNFSV